jgi:hypothetical protein
MYAGSTSAFLYAMYRDGNVGQKVNLVVHVRFCNTMLINEYEIFCKTLSNSIRGILMSQVLLNAGRLSSHRSPQVSCNVMVQGELV